MWWKNALLLLVTFLTSLYTLGVSHSQETPALSANAGTRDATLKAILSADIVATATRQESSADPDLVPVPAGTIDHTATPVQEADLVSSQVIAPETVLDTPMKDDISGSKANGPGDQIDQNKGNEVSLENPDQKVTHVEEIIKGASDEELSSHQREENAIPPVSICTTSVFDTDVSLTLTQTSTPDHPDHATPKDNQQGKAGAQEEVTLNAVPDTVEKGDNSVQTLRADDTLEDVKEFIKEAADAKAEEKNNDDVVAYSTTNEKESTATNIVPDVEIAPHDVELPSVNIRETSTIPPQKDAIELQFPLDGGVVQEVIKDGGDSGETTEGGQEEFPSFGEWTAKVLAEEEKTKLEQESLGNMPGGAVQPKTVKQSRNNYALRDCGAKVLAANREAQNTNGILNGNKDDYMTNPCTAKKWFIVELCEPIQVRTIELASFELFSSQPKTFRVHLSDRYPAKEWHQVGTFHATEERSTHSFQVEDEHYTKFVKVEMVDHFREEHFCPITLFRVFGVDLNYDDDGDSGNEMQNTGDMLSNDEEGGNPTNLFESAKDTVISLVKKVLKVEDNEQAPQVEEVHSGNTGNSTELESLESNLTEDGYPLPCVPDASIPVSPGSDTDNSTVTNSTDIQPQEPYPHTVKNDNFVIKLEDHEQPPSPDRLTEPLVTLIDWNFFSSIGNKELAQSCSSCHGNISALKQRSEGRKNCIYINLLLGSLQHRQSCPAKRRKWTKKVKVKDMVEETSSNILSSESVSVNVQETTVEGEKSEETKAEVSEESVTSSSANDPNFVMITTATPRPRTTKSVVEHLQSSVTEVTKSESESESESIVSPESKIDVSIVEETLVSFSSTVSIVDPSKVATDSNDVTMHPQPGHVLIPTAVAPSRTEELSQDTAGGSSELTHETGEDKAQQLPPVELEPSYNNPSVTKKTAESDDASVSSTPALPPVNEDTTVSLSPPGQSVTNEGEGTTENGQQAEKADPIKEEVTDPPAEVTRDTTLVQPTPVEDAGASLQDSNKVIKAINQSDSLAGEEGKRDLNLVRVPISPHMKRETAIMRLNNRLKALELNVSLSSRFLEELSKRYRKQSDEVMKLLNKTMSRLSNTTKLVEEKDQHNRELIGILEARIDNLTSLVSKLADNVGHLDQKLTERNFTWATMEVVVVFVLLLMSWRRTQSPYITPEIQKLLENMPSGPGPPKRRRRRNSSTGTIGYSSPHPPLVKHSSESALDTQLEFSIVEPLVAAVSSDTKLTEGNKKKKKKKHKNLESKSTIYNRMREVTPSSSSSSNQSSASTAGAFNGPGMAWFDGSDRCPSEKPLSDSQPGIMSGQPSSVSVNGVKCRPGYQPSDSSGGSSTSIASTVCSERDTAGFYSKFPVKASTSASFGGSRPMSTQTAAVRISKSASNKGLSNANVNRNATSKKSKEVWHCRAQSDGNVTIDEKLEYWSDTCKRPPESSASRRLSENKGGGGANRQQRRVSHPTETLSALNGAVAMTDTPKSANQSDKSHRWPGSWKNIISIK
ncbi:SUN domain-containing ossification factor-like [Liolophura sinensis]|uniref:SUN domain-containing ossification factor-like n=1 Tax=Liolophura sinensis TaxID=3198878 RepID=UPI0031590BD3